MSWKTDPGKVSCPCGAGFPSPESLRKHLSRSHPILSNREQAEVVGVLRKILGR